MSKLEVGDDEHMSLLHQDRGERRRGKRSPGSFRSYCCSETPRLEATEKNEKVEPRG